MNSLSDYHRLREEEIRSWDPAALTQAAAEEDSEFPDRIELLLTRLRENTRRSHSPQDPGPLDAAAAKLCQHYMEAGKAQRAFIRSQIDQRLGNILWGFGFVAATHAARKKSEHILKLGLVAQVIENLAAGDVRDSLVVLTLLFHVAKRIGLDRASTFRECAAIAGPPMSAVFGDYLLRSPEVQTLQCMGLREIDSPNGVWFQQI